MAKDTQRELGVRLALVEEQTKRHDEDDRAVHSLMLKSLETVGLKVDAVKERLDKQNGAIPHIQESISNIEKHLTAQDDTQTKTTTALNKVKWKSNVIWGMLAALGIAFSEFLVHKIFL